MDVLTWHGGGFGGKGSPCRGLTTLLNSPLAVLRPFSNQLHRDPETACATQPHVALWCPTLIENEVN